MVDPGRTLFFRATSEFFSLCLIILSPSGHELLNEYSTMDIMHTNLFSKHNFLISLEHFQLKTTDVSFELNVQNNGVFPKWSRTVSEHNNHWTMNWGQYKDLVCMCDLMTVW